MGKIIHSKNISDKSVIIKVLMTQDEMKNFKGNLKDIHMFSENLFLDKASVAIRGNYGATQYFKIPFQLKTRQKYKDRMVVQKVENFSKIFYIYTLTKIDKDQEEPSCVFSKNFK